VDGSVWAVISWRRSYASLDTEEVYNPRLGVHHWICLRDRRIDNSTNNISDKNQEDGGESELGRDGGTSTCRDDQASASDCVSPGGEGRQHHASLGNQSYFFTRFSIEADGLPYVSCIKIGEGNHNVREAPHLNSSVIGTGGGRGNIRKSLILTSLLVFV
jgi:hypothetical protein